MLLTLRQPLVLSLPNSYWSRSMGPAGTNVHRYTLSCCHLHHALLHHSLAHVAVLLMLVLSCQLESCTSIIVLVQMYIMTPNNIKHHTAIKHTRPCTVLMASVWSRMLVCSGKQVARQ